MTSSCAHCIALALSMICIQLATIAAAQAQPVVEDVEALTDNIVKISFDVERYALNYRLASTDESKLKALRYFAGQQAASALQMSTGIVNVQELSGHQIPRAKSLKQATKCNMIGLIVGGSSSAFELTANCSKSVREKYCKQDSNTAKRYVFAKIHEMDDLFARLNRACESNDCPDRQLHQAESRLLRYARDLTLYEFATWYADARSERIGSNIFYLLNIASNTVGAVSTGYALRAYKRSPATGPAVVAAVVADSIAIPSAPISGYAASRLYKHWFSKLYREMGANPYDVTSNLEEELRRYRQFLQVQEPGSFQGNFEGRAAMYDYWNKGYLDYDLKNRRHLRHLQDVAVESSLDGPVLGGLGLAQDTSSTVAYFRYRDQPRTARSLNKTAGILQTTVNGSAITLSTINMLSALSYEWRVGKKGELPDQIIQKRLKMLSECEKIYFGQSKQ